MKTAKVWNGSDFVESTPINGSLSSSYRSNATQPAKRANANIAVAGTGEPSLEILASDPFIFVQPKSSVASERTAIKAFSPVPTVVETISPNVEGLSRRLSAPLKMQVVTQSASLVQTQAGEFYLLTKFQAVVRNEATGQLIVNDVCSAKDGKSYSLDYFKQKFAVELSRHLESHAKHCAGQHLATIKKI